MTFSESNFVIYRRKIFRRKTIAQKQNVRQQSRHFEAFTPRRAPGLEGGVSKAQVTTEISPTHITALQGRE